MKEYKGLVISKGVAIGKPFFFFEKKASIPMLELSKDNVKMEIKRYRGALQKSRSDLELLQKRFIKEGASVIVEILDAHLEILQDPIITQLVEEKIKASRKNTERVFEEVINNYNSGFQNIDDEFFQERTKDIKDVSKRILKHLKPFNKTEFKCEKRSIIIAKELTPSEALEAYYSDAAGIISQKGGYASHAGIIARAKGIPFVTKINVDLLFNVDNIIIDGIRGKVIVEPETRALNKYKKLQNRFLNYFKEIKKSAFLESKTSDGEKIKLFSNIESVNDIKVLLKNKAEGVGLFRSEYLFFTEKQIPSEERQIDIYKQIIEKLNPRPVTIRLFDIGSDKNHLFSKVDLKEIDIEHEHNPSLGCRGIRFLLKNEHILNQQLRAILKVSVYGNVKILLPLVSEINEIRYIKTKVKTICDELKLQNVPIGCMVEVPSVAVLSDLFAQEVDFFAIGTNDLTQYLMAADRTNSNTNHLYDFSQPSLLRLIEKIVKSAKRHNIDTYICGEMAADAKFTKLLIGLGLRNFSISARHIPIIKYAIGKTDIDAAQEMAKVALLFTNIKELKHYVEKCYQNIF